jgi:hypothetical protein
MSREITGWQCEKCLQIWPSQHQADECCANNECRICVYKRIGAKIDCHGCSDKNYFKYVEKIVRYSEYKGELYDEWLGRFSDKESLLQHISVHCPKRVSPKWCFGSTKAPFRINIKDAVENAIALMDDDFNKNQIVDLKELICFITKWNKKQTATTTVIDPKTVVLLEE